MPFVPSDRLVASVNTACATDFQCGSWLAHSRDNAASLLLTSGFISSTHFVPSHELLASVDTACATVFQRGSEFAHSRDNSATHLLISGFISCTRFVPSHGLLASGISGFSVDFQRGSGLAHSQDNSARLLLTSGFISCTPFVPSHRLLASGISGFSADVQRGSWLPHSRNDRKTRSRILSHVKASVFAGWRSFSKGLIRYSFPRGLFLGVFTLSIRETIIGLLLALIAGASLFLLIRKKTQNEPIANDIVDEKVIDRPETTTHLALIDHCLNQENMERGRTGNSICSSSREHADEYMS
jgi:hypothetical protein